MKERLKLIILFVILFLSLFLRVYKIGTYPYGFTPDEASFGYDAYSILKTGKDQWGKKFPLSLESFGDFKPPLYSYILIPFIFLFGLEKWVIRIPNAILGSFSVLVIYMLAKEVIVRIGFKKLNDFEKDIFPLFSSFILAVSPWHISLSRGAFEANLGNFFIPLSLLIFLWGLRKPIFLPFSSIFLGLSLFSYHSPRLFSVILFFLLFLFYRKELLEIKNKKHLILFITIFLLFVFLVFIDAKKGGATRAIERSIFQSALEEQALKRLALIKKGYNTFLARLIENKFTVILRRFVSNYKQYLSFDFLFLRGAKESTYGMVPGKGVIYPIEALGILGFILLLITFRSKDLLIIAFGVLLGFVPAALSTGVGFSGNRSALSIPFLTLVSSLGFCFLLSLLEKKVKKIFLFFLVFVFFLSLFDFLNFYLKESKISNAKGMLYGNLELFEFLLKEKIIDKKVFVSRSLSEPHIYFAFVLAYDPISYQNEVSRWGYKERGLPFVDQLEVYRLGQTAFGDINQGILKDYDFVVYKSSDKQGRDYLLGYETIRTFYYPDGSEALTVAKIK